MGGPCGARPFTSAVSLTPAILARLWLTSAILTPE
jgi:hypothetical protein